MSKNVVFVILGLAVVVAVCFYLQSLVVKQLMPQAPTDDTATGQPAASAPATHNTNKSILGAPTKKQ
jgi:hypothetical protein